MENKNYKMTSHQETFNLRFGEYLQTALAKGENIYQIMLNANEIYAMSFGKYPEKDEIWIDALCYQLLKVVEDLAWTQFPCELKEAQDLLWHMSICELNAVRI